MNKYEPGTRVGEYVLEECVGAGVFGEVWRARHHVWEEDHVAVKLPTEPEYVRYLQREGIVVHGLRHPNVIRVIGFDPYAENPYLVMELVDGPALRQAIDEHPQGLPVEIALTALRGILGALAAAHEANVLHRDLKPGNVLLNLQGRALSELRSEDVKLGDFGLGVGNADALRSIAQSASLAREDALVGTLAYMAPELRDGRGQPDARSDLYAVGVILFEMLTGERPAGAELPSTVRAECPAALDEVFRHLYARHDHRYESARAVLEDLDVRLAPGQRGPAAEAVSPPGLPTEFAVVLQSCGRKKIAVIKALRRARPELDLAEAKAFVEHTPANVFERASAQDAQRWAAELEQAGATVAIEAIGQRASRMAPPAAAVVAVPTGTLASCPACRHVVAADDQFCTQCGHQLVRRVRRCPSCHGYPGQRDQYCIFCGAALPPKE